MKRIFCALLGTLFLTTALLGVAIAQIVVPVPKLNPLGTGFTVVSCNGEVKIAIDADKVRGDEAQQELAKWLDGKAYTSGSCHLIFQPINFGADLRLNIPKSYAVEVSAGASLSIDFGGLRLSQAFVATKPLLAVSGAGHVEIANLDLKGDKSVPCLALASPSALVKASELWSCSEGIRVEASDALIGAADAARYDAEKNLIHDNKLGIHVVSGDRNRFGYNSVFGNASSMINSADDGILIETGANEGLSRPAIVLDEGSGAALRCEADADGVITKRELAFTVPAEGEMEIYLTAEAQESGIRGKQGKTFIGRCSIGNDGICSLPSLLLPELAAGSKSCGVKDLYATALFTGTSSTMYLVQPFDLGVSVILGPPIEVPVPTTGMLEDTHTGNGPGDEVEDETDDSGGGPLQGPMVEGAGTTSGASEGDTATSSRGNAAGPAAAAVKCDLVPAGTCRHSAAAMLVIAGFSLALIVIRRQTISSRTG